jgi:hypothetical protein
MYESQVGPHHQPVGCRISMKKYMTALTALLAGLLLLQRKVVSLQQRNESEVRPYAIKDGAPVRKYVGSCRNQELSDDWTFVRDL